MKLINKKPIASIYEHTLDGTPHYIYLIGGMVFITSYDTKRMTETNLLPESEE